MTAKLTLVMVKHKVSLYQANDNISAEKMFLI